MRFPVADISKKTGENKGNVSSYLNGKKPIPDNFLKTLYEKYGHPGVIKPREQAQKSPEEDFRAELKEANAVIRGYNAWLQRMLELNLGRVLTDQAGMSALIGELLRRDIRQESGGNPETEKEILDKILQRIGTKLSSDVREGIAADAGN